MIILLGSLCLFSPISQSKAFNITTWSSNFRPHGGYVDEIKFHVYRETEIPLAMVDLQTGEIDAYDDRVLQDFHDACARNPDIELTITPSMRYHALTINCALCFFTL